MLTYKVHGTQYTPDVWKFPAGEVGVRSKPFSDHAAPAITLITISASLKSSDEVMELFMLTDSLRRRFPYAKMALRLGYLPYARQDRECNEGDSLSIKVFSHLINSQNYFTVELNDPHSDVAAPLFDRCTVVTQKTIFTEVFQNRLIKEADEPYFTLVAPDAGAYKKTTALVDSMLTASEVIRADKTRNMSDGKITALKIYGDVRNKNCLIVDDIVDGGYTFIQLGEMLREQGAKTLTLIATHGVFSKGHKVITDIYDKVYTTNSYHADRIGEVEGVTYCKLI
jgi:ribose-phosphate pyrophosphokinase